MAMTPLSQFLAEVKERLARATPESYWVRGAYLGADEWNTSKSSNGKFNGEPCPDVPNEYMAQRDCELAACAPADLSRLLELVEAVLPVVEKAEKYSAIDPYSGPHSQEHKELVDALAAWHLAVDK